MIQHAPHPAPQILSGEEGQHCDQGCWLAYYLWCGYQGLGEDEDCQAATENDEKLNSSDSNIKPHQEADTTPEGNSSRSIKSIEDPASAGEVQGDPRTQVQTSVSRLLDE